MNKKEYKDGCEGCDISRGSILLPGGVIELQGDWIVNHYDGWGVVVKKMEFER